MPVDWQSTRAEVTRHLQELIRFNTVNPPGNETQAAAYLARAAEGDGIEARVEESAPGRGNFVARIRGEGRGRPLLLMAHSDVVSVEPEKWTHDPFGGEVVGEQVWGRGAVDTKDLVACELMVMLLVKRQGLTLDRDLIMCTFADEEAGGHYGADWMWQNRRELIDAEVAINEGGGFAVDIAGHRFYLCQTGEKGGARMRLTARGAAGHASMPLPDTAMLHAGHAAIALTEHTFPTVMTETATRMLRSIAATVGGDLERQVDTVLADPRWENLARLPLDETQRRMLYAGTRNTAVPTIIHGGHRINVIPSEIEIDVDGRILPGQSPEDFAEAVRAVVGQDAQVELTSRGGGLEADPGSPLFETIGSVIGELDPGAAVVPFLVPGGTDAKSLPGVKVYGFMPTRYHPEEFDLAHGHDERVSIDNLDFGTRALYEIVTRYCGARGAR
ncbi:MAG TPA: M20/M25/M40 family metallo-hydrolase [Thermomicrobiaceae bacterium]|nr:M20/M25/M40 family metallo-hydrolase [Thermomicrobiaceae bacterium]